MTCVIGIVDNGKVWMGGDSAAIDSEEETITLRKDPKVFRNEDFLIGFAGTYRLGQLIQYMFNCPYRKPDQEIFQQSCRQAYYLTLSKQEFQCAQFHNPYGDKKNVFANV